jgi:hypothetical protein
MVIWIVFTAVDSATIQFLHSARIPPGQKLPQPAERDTAKAANSAPGYWEGARISRRRRGD